MAQLRKQLGRLCRAGSLSFIALIATAAIVIDTSSAQQAELIIGWTTKPQSLDPHYSGEEADRIIAQHLYDSLVTLDASYQPQPDLATRWILVEPGRYRFFLAEQARFSDGTPVTADDVVYSLDRAISGSDAGFDVSIYARGKTAEAVDETTVDIVVPAPAPLLLEDLSRIAIVKRDTGGAPSRSFALDSMPVGSGPYVPAPGVVGERLILERSETSLDLSGAWDQVMIEFFDGRAGLVEALLAGSIDVALDPHPDDIPNLRERDGISVHMTEPKTVVLLSFIHSGDQQTAITSDRRFREAVAAAIDRERLAGLWDDGVASPAFGILPRNHPFTIADEALEEGLAEANNGDETVSPSDLLDQIEEAGAGIPPLVLHTINVERLTLIADTISESLSSFGVSVDVQPEAQVAGGIPSLSLHAWQLQPGTPLPFLQAALLSEADSSGIAPLRSVDTTLKEELLPQLQEALQKDLSSAQDELKSLQLSLLAERQFVPLLHVRRIIATRFGLTVANQRALDFQSSSILTNASAVSR